MDSWNQIDFLVVLFGAVELASSGQGPNLKGLRSIKVGRILLYTIRKIPDVRILVELLGRLAAPLSAAIILNVGFVSLSALFFQQLFSTAGICPVSRLHCPVGVKGGLFNPHGTRLHCPVCLFALHPNILSLDKRSHGH